MIVVVVDVVSTPARICHLKFEKPGKKMPCYISSHRRASRPTEPSRRSLAGEMGADCELYGGAVTTYMPDGFLDGSLLREVPDTQEVYVNGREQHERYDDGLGSDESILIDLLELVDEADLLGALRTHVAEIASFNGSGAQNREFAREEPVGPNGRACVVIEEHLVLCVGLVRWADVATDVVITINVPNVPIGGAGSSKDSAELPQPVAAAHRLLLRMMSELKLVDRSLFV